MPLPSETKAGAFLRLLIEGRVDEVEILLVHLLLGQAQALAEAYKMEYLYLLKCAIRS